MSVISLKTSIKRFILFWLNSYLNFIWFISQVWIQVRSHPPICLVHVLHTLQNVTDLVSVLIYRYSTEHLLTILSNLILSCIIAAGYDIPTDLSLVVWDSLHVLLLSHLELVHHLIILPLVLKLTHWHRESVIILCLLWPNATGLLIVQLLVNVKSVLISKWSILLRRLATKVWSW